MRKKNPQQYMIFTIDAPDIKGKKKLKLGHICFPKSSFWKIIFQTFLYLFVINKVGQRKIFSDQFQLKKNLIWFLKKYFPFSCVCFSKSGFREIIFQTFLCLFASRKVGQ